jgi:hypothetical protein
MPSGPVIALSMGTGGSNLGAGGGTEEAEGIAISAPQRGQAARVSANSMGTFNSPLHDGQENHNWLASRMADKGCEMEADAGILPEA